MRAQLSEFQAEVAAKLDAGWRMRLGYKNGWFSAGLTVVRLVDPAGTERKTLMPQTAQALEAAGYVVEPLPGSIAARKVIDGSV